jgi:hypothetical protein
MNAIYKQAYLRISRAIIAAVLLQCFGASIRPLYGVQDETQTKRGGIGFRVDDNQSIQMWDQYKAVFDRYGFKFAAALNLGLLVDNAAYLDFIRRLQSDGYEFLDHTPNHADHYFTVEDTLPYSRREGVDHIYKKVICLKYQPIDSTTQFFGEGYCDIVGGKAISRSPGTFKDFVSQGVFDIGLFFPSLGKVCGISTVFADNSIDVDSLVLTSFWGEPISLPAAQAIPYRILGQTSLHMAPAAWLLLARRTLELCSRFGIERPFTWILPGGRWPVVSRNEMRSLGDSLQYVSAACIDQSRKCSGEYDPRGEDRYGMQWGDFTEDFTSFAQVRAVIADGIARHYVLFGHSHFSDLLGGWDVYLARMDSLLSWCKAKAIPVRTQKEWANILYDTPGNPYENVFPLLSVDLDEDGLPDGYYMKPGYTDGRFNSADSVSSSMKGSFSVTKAGSICYVNNLAGLEKGANDFYLWTKGAAGDSVEVLFTFPEKNNQAVKFKFPATTANWKRYGLAESSSSNKDLNIPIDVSYCCVRVSCSNYASGTVKVSAFELRRKLAQPIKIVSVPDTLVRTDDTYSYQVGVLDLNSQDSLRYRIDGPGWLVIDRQGRLSGRAPSQGGRYQITVFVEDQHFNLDTQFFNLLVEYRKVLQLSSQTISFGLVPYGSKKDTTISFVNSGLDTTTITSVVSGGFATLTMPEKKIPPGKSFTAILELIAKTKGPLRDEVYIVSDSQDSPDSILISAVSEVLMDTGEVTGMASNFTLYQSYPNPFNPTTTLRYSILYPSKVQLGIYNMLGQLVKTLTEGEYQPNGFYSFQWNGEDLRGVKVSSGVYFCRLLASPLAGGPPFVATNKMLLLK